jgi:phage recombination protein Bet
MKLLSDYSAPEQSALRNEICTEATDDQINYFLRVCAARNVDPFAGLLYMQRRFNQKTQKWKCSVSPTVDGSRAAAARSQGYAGQDEPEFDSEEGKTPKWCKVTVYRMLNGIRCAFTAKCRWDEFVPQSPNDFQWRAKPYHMLSKVTEVQALRKGFPESVPAANEDEIEDIIEGAAPPADTGAQERAALAVQWSNAVAAFKPLGKTEADILKYLGLLDKKDATEEHLERARIWYEELQREKTA